MDFAERLTFIDQSKPVVSTPVPIPKGNRQYGDRQLILV